MCLQTKCYLHCVLCDYVEDLQMRQTLLCKYLSIFDKFIGSHLNVRSTRKN